eukprot:3431219-Rhodomonas_salina.1
MRVARATVNNTGNIAGAATRQQTTMRTTMRSGATSCLPFTAYSDSSGGACSAAAAGVSQALRKPAF